MIRARHRYFGEFMKTLCNALLVAALLAVPGSALTYDYDAAGTEKLMAQLISDVGGFDAIAKNSGRTLPCSHGGTKKITITKKKGKASYTGEYLNCNQNGSIRDGIFEIVLQGDEVLKSSARRSKNGELFDAAMNDNAGKVRELIKAKADVNYTESASLEGQEIEEWTPLMSAAVSGNLDIVRQLINAGAWVNYMNNLAVSAIWIAANNGKLDVVKYLARHGAYIDNRNFEDVTPLMAAAMNGHLEVVRSLIASKAQLDLVHNKGKGDTALMFALANGHTAIARTLVEAGADFNLCNGFGIGAIHIAAAEGNAEATGMLLKHKADLTAKTNSGLAALDIARAKKHASIIELLEKASR